VFSPKLMTETCVNRLGFVMSSMTDLGTLGGSGSVALGINPAGQVVSDFTTAAGESHAFLWERGVMTDLGTLGGNFALANGINPASQVVGWSLLGGGGEPITHAFLWAKGVMTDLGALGGGGNSYAYGINPAGQVVGVDGNHATLWTRK
jgi:probable HAF family extracellular repeat protein